MDTDTDREASVSVAVNVSDSEAESNKIDSLEMTSSNGEVVGELRSTGEVLNQVDLNIACTSEKLVNLDILMMHVATRESDFEAFSKEREHILADSIERALEFDLLSGILDSEVGELDIFMATLESDFIKACELISSYKHLGKTHMEMEEKLLDSETSLKQSREQISEIKQQTAMFQWTLSCLDGEGNWNGDKDTEISEAGQFLNVNAEIKMQTAEQRRHILRMLEKSLAREMDLEKKLSESKQVEEELKFRLPSFEQEIFSLGEEAMNAFERMLEAENAAEVLKGISKELLGRLQIVKLNLNGAIQQETQLKSKLDGFIEQLEIKENVIEDLGQKLSKAEARAVSAEAKFKLLAETNVELNEELGLLKGSGATPEKLDLLERQLRESDIRLQHAVASAEAGQETQNMLYSTIGDMENLIEDLKLKVSKADTRADSAEEKLIILSESHSGLTEELSFLRERLECMEATLHQVEETKLATVRDINIRITVMRNLILQLAIERERLHQQISSLAMENQVMAVKLQQAKKDPPIVMHDLSTCPCESESKNKEEVTELSAAVSEDKTWKNESGAENVVEPVDLTSELGTVRRTDAGLLNYKHFCIIVLIVLISAAAYYFLKTELPI